MEKYDFKARDRSLPHLLGSSILRQNPSCQLRGTAVVPGTVPSYSHEGVMYLTGVGSLIESSMRVVSYFSIDSILVEIQ